MVGLVQGLLESQLQLASGLAAIAAHGVVILTAVVLGGVATIAARRVLTRLATRLARRTETRWDDALIESGVASRLAPLAPVIVIYLSASVFGSAQPWIEALLLVYMVAIVVRVVDAVFDAGLAIYEKKTPSSREIPLRALAQLARVGVVVLGAIFVVTTLVDRLPALLGAEVAAVLRGDRADDDEDIPALIARAREALERVRDDGAPLPAEGAEFLREVRRRGPALVDAAVRRIAEITEGGEREALAIELAPGDRAQLSESLRELCKLARDAGTDLVEAPEELAAELTGGWPDLAESCRKLDAALAESASRAEELRRVAPESDASRSAKKSRL